MVDQGGSQGGGFGSPAGPSWSHSVTFGDGGSARATGTPAKAEHSYASSGDYEIRSDVTCSPCQSVFVLGTATTTVSVGSGCSTADVDRVAVAEFAGYHVEPFERSFNIVCDSGTASVANRAHANPDKDSNADPCAANLRRAGVAGAHSHPYFDNADEMNEGKGCLGRKNWQDYEVSATNSSNRKFSSNDKNWAETNGLSLYMGVTPGASLRTEQPRSWHITCVPFSDPRPSVRP